MANQDTNNNNNIELFCVGKKFEPLREFARFVTAVPSNLRSTWAISPQVDCCCQHLPLPFIIVIWPQNGQLCICCFYMPKMMEYWLLGLN